jgi:hypothetical protein
MQDQEQSTRLWLRNGLFMNLPALGTEIRGLRAANAPAFDKLPRHSAGVLSFILISADPRELLFSPAAAHLARSRGSTLPQRVLITSGV